MLSGLVSLSFNAAIKRAFPWTIPFPETKGIATSAIYPETGFVLQCYSVYAGSPGTIRIKIHAQLSSDIRQTPCDIILTQALGTQIQHAVRQPCQSVFGCIKTASCSKGNRQVQHWKVMVFYKIYPGTAWCLPMLDMRTANADEMLTTKSTKRHYFSMHELPL